MTTPPIHPGRLIRVRMDELGLGVVAAAQLLGVSRPQLQNIIAGRRGISAQMAVRLERKFGKAAEVWLRYQVDHDVHEARLHFDGLCGQAADPAAEHPQARPSDSAGSSAPLASGRAKGTNGLHPAPRK